MFHYRKTRQKYLRHHIVDKTRNQCAFCDDKNLPMHDQVKNDTMYVIPNRTHYDLFEGRRVLDHLLLLPKRHAEKFADFTDAEKLDMLKIIADYESRGYNIHARGVGDIGRSVKHQHTHLIKLSQAHPKFILHIRRPYILIDR